MTTEISIIKKIRHFDAVAARWAEGTPYRTRAINNGRLWRKRLACWREHGHFAHESNYKPEDAGI